MFWRIGALLVSAIVRLSDRPSSFSAGSNGAALAGGTMCEHLADAFLRTKKSIEQDEGSLRAFVVDNGLRHFGISRAGAGLVYREWAPAATSLSLIGDFNCWRPGAHPCTRNERGVWELYLPDVHGLPAIAPGSRIKVLVGILSPMPPHDLHFVERVPAWVQRTTRDELSGAFAGVHVDPLGPSYAWRHARPPRPPSLRIYEAHVGMSSNEPCISTWAAFRTDVLPRIASLGYNALQLMAVQEHGCYESFGYHVTSFFAPACRFGPPDELRALIDSAHGLGMIVLMDVIHSHASANSAEGLSKFDGSRAQYFHSGARGHHRVWGSRLFDYGRDEVLRFLLCNLLWYVHAYRFDGFRFDAVTTMIYTHRGLEPAPPHASAGPASPRGVADADVAPASPRSPPAAGGGCAFGGGAAVGRAAVTLARHSSAESDGSLASPSLAGVRACSELDLDAAVYLMLAHFMLHEAFDEFGLSRPVLTVAEECSGAAHLCESPLRGGLGFDYRLSIGIPPLWVHVVSESPPGRWPLGLIVSELCKRRPTEPTIAYAECHDHSLVGSQTLAFRLMGTEMYSHMSRLSPLTPRIEFGIAALKLIRLLTSALGGEGYLNFMGNEWGHPEWVDFPREGNEYSMARARRRWELVDDPLLRYRWLNDFDRAMNEAAERYGWLHAPAATVLCCDEGAQLLVFERGSLLFAASTSAEQPVVGYSLRLPLLHTTLVLSTDDATWGGRSRSALFQRGAHEGEVLLSLPPACAFVLAHSAHDNPTVQPHGDAPASSTFESVLIGSSSCGEEALVTPLLT